MRALASSSSARARLSPTQQRKCITRTLARTRARISAQSRSRPVYGWCMAGAYEALAAVTGITGNRARGRIKSVRGRAMQECLLLEELPSSLQRVVLQHVGRKALEELPMLQARLSGKSIVGPCGRPPRSLQRPPPRP